MPNRFVVLTGGLLLIAVSIFILYMIGRSYEKKSSFDQKLSCVVIVSEVFGIVTIIALIVLAFRHSP